MDRRAPGGLQAVKDKLAGKLRGWCSYFKGCIPVTWMKQIDGWIRRRIRQIYWKQWKTPQNREMQFKQRCVGTPSKENYAYASNSYWKMARTLPINRALANKTLQESGWVWIQMFEEPDRI
ncbi:MAG: hypothetical protein IJT59_02600 [Desulfovibrionaceae bacterium]|nr:hypothetical protein [Desulfovibrionaceae bacterium]